MAATPSGEPPVPVDAAVFFVHPTSYLKKDHWNAPLDDPDQHANAARAALALDPRPDTLLCMSDLIAISAMREVLQLGLRIPEDVQVVGFDGIEEGQRYHPTLSTVWQHSDQKGIAAVEAFIRGEEGRMLLPYEIRAGESCRSVQR